ncbi:MAG: sugar phosphate isomerase/epimerase [Blastocatellales bacterium]|nr:sugar phosphate isomerase/epimerase [Blastocatellales bacterium]
MNRREFARGLAATGLATIAGRSAGGFRGPLCLFSKHLPGLDWAQLGDAVRLLGFDGVDLTVRPGGHVAPDRAAEELPRAVSVLGERGIKAPMITTALLDADEPAARPILAAAGRLGVRYVKPGYYRYAFRDVRSELEAAGRRLRSLAVLARECGVEIGYHNHADYMGAPVWDIARVIEPLDARAIGYYFDVRHAVVEGGSAGWKIALNLVAPRLKMIAIKDFYWEKSASGWRVRDCPLGEGMVDWGMYFKLLREGGFEGPVSLHVEYDVGGTTAAEKESRMIGAIGRDLKFLKNQLQSVYGA